VQSDEEDIIDLEQSNPRPRRVAIAKLIAASLLEQEATLLNHSSLELRNHADTLFATHVIEQVKMRLRKVAANLRKP
jgi:capsule polysaccharide export protein KpsE/RkpR